MLTFLRHIAVFSLKNSLFVLKLSLCPGYRPQCGVRFTCRYSHMKASNNKLSWQNYFHGP